ncbi:MAG TPA: CHAD domain-containing protein [Acetobacteraceae bacterium]|nr:CHAD domain-containing protein [Acetobacteraceae bacterium]
MLNEQIGRATRDAAVDGLTRLVGNDEVELKLLAPAGVLDQLRQAPAITRRARNAGVARRLDAVYYDTQDRTLFSHGMSLRVRRNGSRYVQTLKRDPVQGHPFARGEWETSVDSVAPDLALLPVPEIGAPLDQLTADALEPVFTTKVRRRTLRLDHLGAVVEVAFDEGSIETGGRCEPVTEIELELKSGGPRALYELGIELLEIAPLRIGTQSKADRGYQLAFDLTPKAMKATTQAITAEHTVDDIIGLLLGTCQHQLLANQTVAEGGRDPEGVHQMRVALRRFRTACALLHRELGAPALQAFSAEGKWLAKLLGAARDWDVFITETLSRPSQALTSEVDFDGLRQAAEPHRRVAYAAVREALASQRYNRFQLSLSLWSESRGWRNELETGSLAILLEPAPAFAGRVLTRLHHKALKRGADFRNLRPEGRHQVRIALKKLRYAMYFFQGLHGENDEARDYHRCLAKLQDALGHDNDASMTWPFLCALARDPVTPEVQRTIGAVMGWQARDRVETATTLRKHWRRFKGMAPFWPR